MKYEYGELGGKEDNDRVKPNIVRNIGPSTTFNTTNRIWTGRVAPDPPR